jgi:hypothetical protein
MNKKAMNAIAIRSCHVEDGEIAGGAGNSFGEMGA